MKFEILCIFSCLFISTVYGDYHRELFANWKDVYKKLYDTPVSCKLSINYRTQYFTYSLELPYIKIFTTRNL